MDEVNKDRANNVEPLYIMTKDGYASCTCAMIFLFF